MPSGRASNRSSRPDPHWGDSAATPSAPPATRSSPSSAQAVRGDLGATCLAISRLGRRLSGNWLGPQLTGMPPVYLMVARTGTTLSAYTSSDGSTWTPIAGSTVTLSNLGGALLGGLAVTSRNGGALCTANFDTVALTTS